MFYVNYWQQTGDDAVGITPVPFRGKEDEKGTKVFLKQGRFDEKKACSIFSAVESTTEPFYNNDVLGFS